MSQFDDLLKSKVAARPRDLVVRGIRTTDVKFGDGRTADKLVLSVEDVNNGKVFEISDIWATGRGTEPEVKSLWITMNSDSTIPPNSAIGTLLKYYNLETVGDLVDTQVKGWPDKKGYFVIIAADGVV